MLQRKKHGYLLSIEDINSIKLAIPVLDGALSRLSFQEDIQKVLHSNFCSLYKNIKNLDSHFTESYLRLDHPLAFKRLLAACRLFGGIYLILNVKKTSTRIDLREICDLYSTNSKETLDHLLCQCPMYEAARVEYLQFDGLWEVLTYSTKPLMSRFYYFMAEMLKRRSFVLENCHM